MGLPLKFIDGVIGKLILNIPWKNMIKQRIRIDLENFHLVFKVDIKDFKEYLIMSKNIKKIKIINKIK